MSITEKEKEKINTLLVEAIRLTTEGKEVLIKNILERTEITLELETILKKYLKLHGKYKSINDIEETKAALKTIENIVSNSDNNNIPGSIKIEVKL